MNKEQVTPSEWQEEKTPFGSVRRFRMIGNIKEYETTITTSSGTFTQSQLKDMQRREKEQKKQPKAEKQHNNCPFRSGINSKCHEDCAMYSPKGCSMIRSFEGKAHRETAGLFCPIASRECTELCEFYKDGCVIAVD